MEIKLIGRGCGASLPGRKDRVALLQVPKSRRDPSLKRHAIAQSGEAAPIAVPAPFRPIPLRRGSAFLGRRVVGSMAAAAFGVRKGVIGESPPKPGKQLIGRPGVPFPAQRRNLFQPDFRWRLFEFVKQFIELVVC